RTTLAARRSGAARRTGHSVRGEGAAGWRGRSGAAPAGAARWPGTDSGPGRERGGPAPRPPAPPETPPAAAVSRIEGGLAGVSAYLHLEAPDAVIRVAFGVPVGLLGLRRSGAVAGAVRASGGSRM